MSNSCWGRIERQMILNWKTQVSNLLQSINTKLDKVLLQLNTVAISAQEIHKDMEADLSALQLQVQQNTQVEASALALIQGLASQIQGAAGDPVAIGQLVDQLNASANSLAAAVTANTGLVNPSAPQPNPAPGMATQIPQGQVVQPGTSTTVTQQGPSSVPSNPSSPGSGAGTSGSATGEQPNPGNTQVSG